MQYGGIHNGTKVIFAYHSLDRVQQRYPEVSYLMLALILSDQSNWVKHEVDEQSGGNKGDGVKLKVTIKVMNSITLRAIVVKKMERGRPTLIVTTVHE